MVLRHADRTPKQKVKVSLSIPEMLQLFSSPKKEVKLKSDGSQDKLKAMLHVVHRTLESRDFSLVHDKNPKAKLKLVAHVLTELFPGTKIQLKPQKTDGDKVTRCLLVCKWGGMITLAGVHQANQLGKWLRNHLETIVGKEHLSSYLQNVQVWSNNERRVKRVRQSSSMR